MEYSIGYIVWTLTHPKFYFGLLHMAHTPLVFKTYFTTCAFLLFLVCSPTPLKTNKCSLSNLLCTWNVLNTKTWSLVQEADFSKLVFPPKHSKVQFMHVWRIGVTEGNGEMWTNNFLFFKVYLSCTQVLKLEIGEPFMFIQKSLGVNYF